MTNAYAPYRAALFRTNGSSQAEAEQALNQARQAWKALSDRFGDKPVAPYDRDSGFANSLAQVAAVYEAAGTQIRDKKLREAHETLEKARDLMAELRRRNGVVTFSDHMNEYHAQMEHLIDGGPALLGGPQAMMQMMARVGALDYLAGRLRSEAPASATGDPAFKPLLDAVEKSVANLRQSVLSQDAAKTGEAISGLKKPYSQLFLKFG